MKTSLIIEDSLYQAAQKEAQKTGKTISDTLSHWARIGREALGQRKKNASPAKLHPVDLGGPPSIDLNCRRDWMDALDT